VLKICSFSSRYEEMISNGNVVLREKITKALRRDEVRKKHFSQLNSRRRVIDTHFSGLVSCSMKFKFRNREKSRAGIGLELLFFFSSDVGSF
jgi:hypothetical protein